MNLDSTCRQAVYPPGAKGVGQLERLERMACMHTGRLDGTGASQHSSAL